MLVLITFGFVLYGSFFFLPDKIDQLQVVREIENGLFKPPILVEPDRERQVQHNIHDKQYNIYPLYILFAEFEGFYTR